MNEGKLIMPVSCLQCEKILIRMHVGTKCNKIRIKCDACNADFIFRGRKTSEKSYEISQKRVGEYALSKYKNPVDIKCQTKGCNHTLFIAYKGFKVTNLEVYCQSCHEWSTFDFKI